MEKNSTIFNRSLIKEKVKILPKEIGSNIREVLIAKLRIALEGTCTRHGYVRPGSIKIHDVSPGRIEGSSLNGDIIYFVTVVADVCNPVPGHVVPGRIVNSNKFGILAHSGIEIDGKYTTILEIVISRHSSLTTNSDIPVDSVRVGDDVFVEVLGKTYELADTKISIAGRLLRTMGASKRTLVNTQVLNPDISAPDDSDEDVVDNDVEIGVEDVEDEEEVEEEEEDIEDEEEEDIEDEEEYEEEVEDDFEGDEDLTADDDDFDKARDV
jgi:DNA-directed RNA polymerase subunit E'/Rpb7